ncbi:cytochrome ubiquinol oxidase subunit I [Flavitalea sp. BT771]|uniref:cytochrome ubiquinol oxidase subunit I n=1 Tax=Flavitalea sp. BT771 TaxID=3063329 RepID=UPI0026E3329B|nr:cytochrome ubiquinol oxidase subunit I [Flavitalea sp. BT771]MDO6433349.1 cytochrome ubiquinol oxidase subunit I [Flavitalea sp. BT771]MDV6222746.1 cytochrome ubiquinol oxidase subunit I [Flavitalea sp. BT771]
MDVEILARIQFAFTIAFHYIYPPLSIGLGLVLVIMEGLYLKTGNRIYEQAVRFWIRIFALIFGIGVATGIIMEFEFGTNWATYSKYVGDIFGSALAAEGIFAFALESGFLGVLIFGWKRVSPRVHFISTIMVFFGSLFSAVWIVVANSWQQTPAGYHIVGEGLKARAEITDFWAMVFNPSSIDRLLHVWIAAILAGAFLVLSVNAWYILHKKHLEIARPSFKIALAVATVFSLLQLFTGHRSADGVSKYQPAKLAAMEGHYDSSSRADMYLFGYVDNRNGRTSGLKIPGGLSFLVHGDFNAPIRGLRSFKPDERPSQVNSVFQFYHLMVAIGTGMIALTLFGSWLWWKGKLFDKRWLMWIFAYSVLLPQIGNQAGWFTAELGRQPWVVYGLLKTSDGLSKIVTANQIIFSLILFTLVYIVLFVLFLFLMHRKIEHGPVDYGTREEIEDGARRDNPILEH